MILYLLSAFLFSLNIFRRVLSRRRTTARVRRFFQTFKLSSSSLYLFIYLPLLANPYTPLLAQTEVGGLPPTNEVVEPDDYRTNDYRSPVPRTLKGAKVISSNEAEKLITNRSNIFIDVYPKAPKPENLPDGTLWRDAGHSTIQGAYWLPNVGFGVLSPEVETYFKTRLETLTKHAKNSRIIFLCMRNCWMSWNAAKRAISWGYTSVHWFPDGTDGWMMLGNSLVSVEPMP